MSLLGRTQVREHTGSYQTIQVNAPLGLQCLKSLLEEEDSRNPNRSKLSTTLAKDFRDLENGSERSKGREDIIELITSKHTRYRKYQTDLAHTWCITNANKTQTVLFEGIRFIMLQKDTEWIRIPLSGRIEVRSTVLNGKTSGEVIQRKVTLDSSGFWKRISELNSAPNPAKGGSQPTAQDTPRHELPGELSLSPGPGATKSTDEDDEEAARGLKALERLASKSEGENQYRDKQRSDVPANSGKYMNRKQQDQPTHAPTMNPSSYSYRQNEPRRLESIPCYPR